MLLRDPSRGGLAGLSTASRRLDRVDLVDAFPSSLAVPFPSVGVHVYVLPETFPLASRLPEWHHR